MELLSCRLRCGDRNGNALQRAGFAIFQFPIPKSPSDAAARGLGNYLAATPRRIDDDSHRKSRVSGKKECPKISRPPSRRMRLFADAGNNQHVAARKLKKSMRKDAYGIHAPIVVPHGAHLPESPPISPTLATPLARCQPVG